MVSHRRYFLVLTTVYAVFWAALAIDPHDRGDWALENVLVVVAAVLLFFSYKRVLLSRISKYRPRHLKRRHLERNSLKETCRRYP